MHAHWTTHTKGRIIVGFPLDDVRQMQLANFFTFAAADTFRLINFNAHGPVLPKFACARATSHAEVLYGSSETAEFMTLIM
jgi:hypothetical protein